MNTDKKIFIILSIILIAGLISAFIRNQKNMANRSSQTTNPKQVIPEVTLEKSEKKQETKLYSLSEINKHNTTDDCWFVIEDKVYNATDYIKTAKHPGGRAIIEGCGKDATKLFMSRPMGSGTPHSQKAREALALYYIGELER